MSRPETRSTDSGPSSADDLNRAGGAGGVDGVDDPGEALASIDIAAGIDRVWEALVTDGGLEPWMGRGATIDPQPDGLLQVPDVVGGFARRGLVHTVETENQLGFTWWPEHRPLERSDVSITLTPTETGTRVTVIEAPPLQRFETHAVSSANSAQLSNARGMSAHAKPSQLASSLRGCWSWRLAVLSLASQMVRV